jgi:plasmid stabilization system protein ParE
MNFSFHASAEQDVADAQDFYGQHAGFQVATRFLDELQRIIQLLLQYPGLGTPTTKNRRVFPLKAFPYSVVYRAQDDHLRILIVRHQSRKPSFASNRH